MNYADWYTDLVQVYRVVDVQEGALTRKERQLIQDDIRGRIYQSDSKPIKMELAAASVQQEYKLATGVDVDIRTGDELLVQRGAVLGPSRETIRAFAGDPNYYLEPFGAVMPGLAHQEIRLMQQERVK